VELVYLGRVSYGCDGISDMHQITLT